MLGSERSCSEQTPEYLSQEAFQLHMGAMTLLSEAGAPCANKDKLADSRLVVEQCNAPTQSYTRM